MPEPQSKFTEIDLTIPFNYKELLDDAEGCFTREWDPSIFNCSVCADSAVCGTLYSLRVKQRALEHEKEKSPYLDKANFDNISLGDIVGLPSKEVLSMVIEQSKCDDRETCKHWLFNYLTRNSLKISNGVICQK